MIVSPDTIPDALMMPESLKRGQTLFERLNSVLDVAEPMLGVDRSKGERAYIRRQGNNKLFVTKDLNDTINGSQRTPLRGRPRYDWIAGKDGIQLGYMKPCFKELVADAT